MSWTRKNRWVLIVLTFIRWNRNKPFTFFLSFHLLYKTLVFLNRDNLVWNRRRTELSSAGCPSADTDVLTDEVEEEELISQYFLFGFCSVEKWSVLVSSLFPFFQTFSFLINSSSWLFCEDFPASVQVHPVCLLQVDVWKNQPDLFCLFFNSKFNPLQLFFFPAGAELY